MEATKKYKSQTIYLDADDNPCLKAKAVQARILEEFPDGSGIETWGFISQGKEGKQP